MKLSRAAWLLVAIALLLVILVLFLPARWVAPLVQPRLHGMTLEDVHGLVWNGTADRLRGLDGRPLGRLRWQLSRSALWGRLDLRLDLAGPRVDARGHLQRDAQGRPVWSEVWLRTNLAGWAPRLDSSLGAPQGTLTAELQRVVLQGSWPIEAEGRIQWRDAVMKTRTLSVALGDLGTNLDGANGVLAGRPHDLGRGPLQVDGQWQASPLGWRLDLLLQPRTTDPALRRWLARLGRPEADGSVHLHRRGGLAASMPETAR
ncbi:MAG TPA: type II secretion system protein N [Frateuria sp.]|uniref:type II secretion system protein N n=1 Tax=Frateuria sp. TaxID=2211372 RepID=UPI002D811060|nr:type II secretion system protein N [Frateuria sp.]HET6804666.1 type II secretion system protein N [Frateuria sp.]